MVGETSQKVYIYMYGLLLYHKMTCSTYRTVAIARMFGLELHLRVARKEVKVPLNPPMHATVVV